MRKWLKQSREECKLSQQDMADKLRISLSYYNMIENGERQKKIDLNILSKLARALNISIDELIQYECGDKPN